MTNPTLLIGTLRGAIDWAISTERDIRDPDVLLGTIGSEAVRQMERLGPDGVTIILVPGWGARGAERDKARAMVADFRARGADVRLWAG